MDSETEAETHLVNVTLTITPPIADAIDLIRQEERHREACNVVVAFEGGNYPAPSRFEGPRNAPIFTEAEISLVFETLQECIRIQQLRLEWNILAAHFFEQPPLIPLGVLRSLLTLNPHLHTLSLYRMQLTGDYQDELTGAVSQNTSLHTLRIEFCKSVGSSNLDNAVSTLSKLPNLKEMEVIGLPEFRARVCSSDSLRLLGDCQRLQCIKLWGGIWQNSNPGENSLVALAQGLQTTRTVKDLEIGLFQLNLQSSLALAGLIRNNSTLNRIWLDSNTVVTTETLSPLTEALKGNTSILNFNIVSTAAANNQSSTSEDPGIQKLLVDMLETNCSMRHCTIRTTTGARADDATEEDASLQAQMDLYLRLNRVGRKALLVGKEDRNQWLVALSCEREHTSVVFYLLSRNPTFISQCVTNPRKRTCRQITSYSSPSPMAKRRRVSSLLLPQRTPPLTSDNEE